MNNIDSENELWKIEIFNLVIVDVFGAIYTHLQKLGRMFMKDANSSSTRCGCTSPSPRIPLSATLSATGSMSDSSSRRGRVSPAAYASTVACRNNCLQTALDPRAENELVANTLHVLGLHTIKREVESQDQRSHDNV